MFKVDDYIVRPVDGMRYVYRITNKTPDKYEVQVPLFVCWGSTFARWSKPKLLTKKYIEGRCTKLDEQIAKRYRDIKKGQSTNVLFD